MNERVTKGIVELAKASSALAFALTVLGFFAIAAGGGPHGSQHSETHFSPWSEHASSALADRGRHYFVAARRHGVESGAHEAISGAAADSLYP